MLSTWFGSLNNLRLLLESLLLDAVAIRGFMEMSLEQLTNFDSEALSSWMKIAASVLSSSLDCGILPTKLLHGSSDCYYDGEKTSSSGTVIARFVDEIPFLRSLCR